MIGVTVTVLHKGSEEELEDAGPLAKKIEMTTASVRQADDRGEYRIFGLKPGEYHLKATETVRIDVFSRRVAIGSGTSRSVAGRRGNASRLRNAAHQAGLSLRDE